MTNSSTVFNFFATPTDIGKVLRTVEASYPLQYFETGLFDDPERPVFPDFGSLPQLGIARSGDSNLEPTFIMLLQGDKLNIRQVQQRRGGNKFAVDQQANPGTVVIRPGGIYKDSALIAGMVGTVHHDEKAEMLIGVFSSALKQDFTKMQSYLVGPEAKQLHADGRRFTHSLSAPMEFDLSV